MKEVVKLNEAFHTFSLASKNLQTYYDRLHERVQYLTVELEKKNRELNRAVSETRESKDYLHTVLQSIGEAMIVLSPDEKITTIHRAAEGLLGVVPDKVMGLGFSDLGIEISEDDAGMELVNGEKKYSVIISRSAVACVDG